MRRARRFEVADCNEEGVSVSGGELRCGGRIVFFF
jgi:hypothetical protein